MSSIEKCVPIPPWNYRKYPLSEMEVGDSFVAENRKQDDLSGYLARFGRKNGVKFTTRKVGLDVRVWRIA